jgi:putative membrane-bound dehydrogenase-like protein
MKRASMMKSLIIALIWITPLRTGAGDDLAKELPRIPATEAKDALKTFRVHSGFHLELVASEPLVTDPVSVCFDADGRLYVVEMRGYPYPERTPSGNVSLLEDPDGDGVFDKSTIFVEGLSWPTAVVPYDGGVFVAVAPDILYAKDLDGDGKADVKKVMFTGFGTQNVQGLVNGLVWGIDGWICGSSGGNGGDVKNLTRPDAKPVIVRGRDFRFKPDGSAFEPISGGGQFGHSFDDWGHRFVCNNSENIRQVLLPARELDRNPALAVSAVTPDIALDGGAGPVYRISAPEPWRVVRTRQRLADPAFANRLAPTEKFAFGFFTSATGVTIYRGSAFPAEYRGNAFIGDVGGNLVHRKTLNRNGSLFSAQRSDKNVEFIASTDNWFRPVNFANTPDGTLLILDMYRETIEHPASIPEPIKKHLDLTSGRDRGRIYRLAPDGFKPRPKPALSGAKTTELVGLLAHADGWWRETAQRLLIERNDPAAVPALREMLGESARPAPASALGKVHALWTLDSLGKLQGSDLVAVVGEVRSAARRLLDAEPGLREQVARLCAARAEESPACFQLLTAAAEDPDAMVRFAAALAFGDVKGDRAIAPLVKVAALAKSDFWTRSAVESALAGRAGTFLEALSNEAAFLNDPVGRAWLEDVASLVGAEGKESEARAVLDRFAGLESDAAGARAAVLGLGRGLRRAGKSLRGFVNGPIAEKLSPMFDRAARVARSNDSTAARIESIRLLGLGAVPLALEVLPPLLEGREPTEIQLAALRTMSDLPDGQVAVVVAERWNALGPAARREAMEVLLARPERVNTLLDAVERKAIALSEIDATRRKQLLEHRDLAVRNRSKAILGSARSDPSGVIAAYRESSSLAGDAARGKAIFLTSCATCHRAEGQGNEVGPNLATVAGRAIDDLVVHILDPNREVPPAYVNYNVATTDGRVLSGLIAEETGATVTLKRAEGAADVIPRERIEAMTSTGLSLMPEGLEKQIGDPRAMADLIAYLRNLQNGVASPATR